MSEYSCARYRVIKFSAPGSRRLLICRARIVFTNSRSGPDRARVVVLHNCRFIGLHRSFFVCIFVHFMQFLTVRFLHMFFCVHFRTVSRSSYLIFYAGILWHFLVVNRPFLCAIFCKFSPLQDQIRQIKGPTIHRRKGDRGSRLPALASAYTVKMTVLTGSVLQSIQVF